MTDSPDEFDVPSLWAPLPGKGRSLYRRAADLIREAIIVGELKPGTRLVESEISEQLGISRGPIREAIRELEQEGLVRSFPNRGAVVVASSEVEVHELLIPIRLVIESFAVTRAIGNIDESDVEVLKGFVDSMGHGDLTATVDADIAFHEYLLEKSGEPNALQIWRTIVPRIRAYFFRHGLYRNTSVFRAEHAAVLEAILDGDVSNALAVLRDHLEVAWLADQTDPES